MNDEVNTQPERVEFGIVNTMKGLREEIEKTKEAVLDEKKDILSYPNPVGVDRGEQLANLTLAYRHLEDAKMRLGKVIQATEGRSVYDGGNK
jgi:hypothetical protein